MKTKPDPDFLCDEFGTLFELTDDMCLGCDSMDFCWELHNRIIEHHEFLNERANTKIGPKSI
jgi:hypothetical protein